MPVDYAAQIHKKADPRSDYEKKFQLAHEVAASVFACPYGCREGKVDDLGHCDHLVGFTNTKLPDGEVKAVPEGATMELLGAERDKLKRRKLLMNPLNADGSGGGPICGPLKTGDYLVRVNGTTRRVYREVVKVEPIVVPPAVTPPAVVTPPEIKDDTTSKEAVAGKDASFTKARTKPKRKYVRRAKKQEAPAATPELAPV